MNKKMLTKEDSNYFQEHGYLIKRNYFEISEISKINEAIDKNRNFKNNTKKQNNFNNVDRKIVLWNEPGEDLLGVVPRLARLVDAMQLLLYDEVYHYHSKLTDVPIDGTGWMWHQDYGYWYQNSCLFPDMGSVMVALEPCFINNGCLQVISKSHKLGRLNHIEVTDKFLTINQERLKFILNVLERVDCELNQGDALFTHCNLLHASNKNISGRSRRTLICCYNTKHNNPVIEHHHPCYKPLKILADDSIKKYNVNKFKNDDDFIPDIIEKYPTLM